jgi:hypothetical protein
MKIGGARQNLAPSGISETGLAPGGAQFHDQLSKAALTHTAWPGNAGLEPRRMKCSIQTFRHQTLVT